MVIYGKVYIKFRVRELRTLDLIAHSLESIYKVLRARIAYARSECTPTGKYI